ncbi:MAG: metal-sensing transcriptional repressor [Spirochaetes bacterium]|uniref:Copper-sensing transcriptional repressor CsoR n=1 Tax=Candidatus Ornithospirochaeta stercoripullorum TaxID=2840899 RepID=A0A9D9H5W8_9SPIO|nr:metal-sensing transcriptional repressor [Candidatus Ornithospirochaeta stercoripullorum]
MKAEKDSVTRKIKIARGQLDGILKMIDDDRYCIDIATQLMASQSILRKATQEVLQAHIRSCVSESLHTDVPNPKIEEALRVLEKMAEL